MYYSVDVVHASETIKSILHIMFKCIYTQSIKKFMLTLPNFGFES